MRASIAGPGVEVIRQSFTEEYVQNALCDAAVDDTPTLDVLLNDALNLEREEWDWALPQPLLQKAYGSLYLSVDEAMAWVRKEFGADIEDNDQQTGTKNEPQEEV